MPHNVHPTAEARSLISMGCMTSVYANGQRDTDEHDRDPEEAPETPPDEPQPPDIEDPPTPEGERGPYVVGPFSHD